MPFMQDDCVFPAELVPKIPGTVVVCNGSLGTGVLGPWHVCDTAPAPLQKCSYF